VVEGRHDSSIDKEEKDCDNVAGNKGNTHQMEHFPRNELKRMNVHRVRVASRRRMLLVVVLVNQRIQPTYVQNAMKRSVYQVVQDQEREKGSDSVKKGNLVQVPLNVLRVLAAVPDHTVRQERRGEAVPKDKRNVQIGKFVQMASAAPNAPRN